MLHIHFRFLLLVLAGLASLLLQATAPACTTAVVSGRATVDGRPLLWKNRDTSEARNRVVYSTRGRYPYLAVVNAGSSGSSGSVWMGVNEAGFCIENSWIKDMPRGDKPGMGNSVKFDANDPTVAPHGYIVRANFSMTGTGQEKLAEGDELAELQRPTHSSSEKPR